MKKYKIVCFDCGYRTDKESMQYRPFRHDIEKRCSICGDLLEGFTREWQVSPVYLLSVEVKNEN